MFLTMPLTVAPSCSEASSCSRSAPAVSSSTARRDTTTLLRLRSSLMTLNSISLPSYGVVSFTGRRSTSEPGRKARMPLAMTVRPPFTLPVITPLIFSPLSSAFSRLEPGGHALGLVARQARRAVAVFQRLDRDADEVADLDFDLRRRRCGILRSRSMLSDFSPAFTTTKLSSTLTTSAVITSPTRISLRLRLSSNSAAKRSRQRRLGRLRLTVGETLACR